MKRPQILPPDSQVPFSAVLTWPSPPTHIKTHLHSHREMIYTPLASKHDCEWLPAIQHKNRNPAQDFFSPSVGSFYYTPLYYNGLSKAFEQETHKWALCLHVIHFLCPLSILSHLWVLYAWISVYYRCSLCPEGTEKGIRSHRTEATLWFLEIKLVSSNWATSPAPTLTFSLIHYQNPNKSLRLRAAEMLL